MQSTLGRVKDTAHCILLHLDAADSALELPDLILTASELSQHATNGTLREIAAERSCNCIDHPAFPGTERSLSDKWGSVYSPFRPTDEKQDLPICNASLICLSKT